MPIYDYRCEDCNTRYEVYHKVREEAEDIVCPHCQSRSHKKVMSVPAAAVIGSSSSGDASSYGACDNAGGCGCGAGGACGIN